MRLYSLTRVGTFPPTCTQNDWVQLVKDCSQSYTMHTEVDYKPSNHQQVSWIWNKSKYKLWALITGTLRNFTSHRPQSMLTLHDAQLYEKILKQWVHLVLHSNLEQLIKQSIKLKARQRDSRISILCKSFRLFAIH